MIKEGVNKIILSKNKMLIAFCFCFIIGASSFSFLENNRFLFPLYIIALVFLFFIIICWSVKWLRFFIFCALIFILGGCRFLITIPENNSEHIHFYDGKKVVVHGFVSQEPDRGVSDAQYIVQASQVRMGGDTMAVSGKIIMKTQLYPQYHYGDQIEASCLLQKPKNSQSSKFNYIKYLAKQHVRSICASPSILSVGDNIGNPFISMMLGAKHHIESRISRLWPEPDSSLLAGILYGSRSGLPDSLRDDFSRTGVSHIVAVSGYNVTIIVVALQTLLIYIGLFRKQSFWLLMALIIMFVFFTGASASVVRAGLMAFLVLLSQHIGRLSAIDRVLVYAATVMLVYNPYLLVWDAGFQLSFLATIGLVYISPLVQNFLLRYIKIRHVLVDSMVEVFATTISAIIATLPLMLYQFGRFSVVAPVVNMLILWIIPFLMFGGFAALVISILFFPFAQLMAWIVLLGTRYVIMLVHWFGGQPWAAAELHVSVWSMMLAYGCMIFFIIKKQLPATIRSVNR